MYKRGFLQNLLEYTKLSKVRREHLIMTYALAYLSARYGWRHVRCALLVLEKYRSADENPPRVFSVLKQLCVVSTIVEQSPHTVNAAVYVSQIKPYTLQSHKMLFDFWDNHLDDPQLSGTLLEFYQYLDRIQVRSIMNDVREPWERDIQPWLDTSRGFESHMIYLMVGHLIFSRI